MAEEPQIPKTPEEPASSVTKNASWGAFISIVVILAMVIIGAFYSWGNHVAQQHPESVQTTP